MRHSVAALRARLSEHNRQVLLLAGLTLVVAAGLWYISFAVLYWLTLLALTVTKGIQATPPETLPAFFIYGAGLLILITWIARRFSRNDMPRDEKSPLEFAADFLLAIPRATLAVWGNLSAWQRLSDAELEQAVALLDRLSHDRRLPLYEVAQEIPNRRMSRKIVLALQLIRVLEIGRSHGAAYLKLARSPAGALPPRRTRQRV